jgi:hypothetical protein
MALVEGGVAAPVADGAEAEEAAEEESEGGGTGADIGRRNNIQLEQRHNGPILS